MDKEKLIEWLETYKRSEEGKDQVEKSLVSMYNLGISHAIDAVKQADLLNN